MKLLQSALLMVVQRAHAKGLRSGAGFQAPHLYGITFQISFLNQGAQGSITAFYALQELGATHIGQQLRIAQAQSCGSTGEVGVSKQQGIRFAPLAQAVEQRIYFIFKHHRLGQSDVSLCARTERLTHRFAHLYPSALNHLAHGVDNRRALQFAGNVVKRYGFLGI